MVERKSLVATCSNRCPKKSGRAADSDLDVRVLASRSISSFLKLRASCQRSGDANATVTGRVFVVLDRALRGLPVARFGSSRRVRALSIRRYSDVASRSSKISGGVVRIAHQRIERAGDAELGRELDGGAEVPQATGDPDALAPSASAVATSPKNCVELIAVRGRGREASASETRRSVAVICWIAATQLGERRARERAVAEVAGRRVVRATSFACRRRLAMRDRKRRDEAERLRAARPRPTSRTSLGFCGPANSADSSRYVSSRK